MHYTAKNGGERGILTPGTQDPQVHSFSKRAQSNRLCHLAKLVSGHRDRAGYRRWHPDGWNLSPIRLPEEPRTARYIPCGHGLITRCKRGLFGLVAHSCGGGREIRTLDSGSAGILPFQGSRLKPGSRTPPQTSERLHLTRSVEVPQQLCITVGSSGFFL